MKRFSKKIHTAFTALLFLGGAVAVFVLVSHMETREGEALRERLQLIADEQVFEQQFNTLVSTVRDTEEERATLAGFILEDERDTIELLSTLDTIAKEQSVELTTRELRENEVEGSFNTLLLGYEINGQEAAVIRMSEILETLPYHGHVTSFMVERTIDEATGNVTMTAKLDLELSIKKHDQ